jgi:hypothetical protein
MAVNPLHKATQLMDLGYRAVTNPIRLMPDFIIIGAQKGGTTSLYNYLTEHPNIISASTKEVHFFDHRYHRGLRWYRAHFPTAIEQYYAEHVRKQVFITGEASPGYLFHPLVPKRIANLLPHVRLIVLLRNPVDRLYSQYRHKVALGHEKLPVEEAVAREEERLQGEREKIAMQKKYYSANFQHFSYKTRGRYAEQLEAWFSLFPREQFLIMKSEDMYKDPSAIYKQTLEFLNIPIYEPKSLQKEYKQYNKSKEVPSRLDSGLRKELVEYFKPHNARLYELLGRDFGWDH